MKKHLSKIIFALIFVIGFCLLLYPVVSNLYNRSQNDQIIEEYKREAEKMDETTVNETFEKAHLYNQNLYTPKELEKLGLKYETTLNPYGNKVMGYIEIPKINVSLIIYHSTNDDVLQNGVGHVEGTSLPVGGKNTHCALAAHRGLPSAKLFSDVDYMEVGDVFYIHVLDEVLEYRVDSVLVVEPQAVSNLKVENNRDLVTLVTCTPYGINSHRLLVRGTRVLEGDSTYLSDTANVQNELFKANLIYLIPISLSLLVVGAVVGKNISKNVKKRRSE